MFIRVRYWLLFSFDILNWQIGNHEIWHSTKLIASHESKATTKSSATSSNKHSISKNPLLTVNDISNAVATVKYVHATGLHLTIQWQSTYNNELTHYSWMFQGMHMCDRKRTDNNKNTIQFWCKCILSLDLSHTITTVTIMQVLSLWEVSAALWVFSRLLQAL